jgi:hypothetical protein
MAARAPAIELSRGIRTVALVRTTSFLSARKASTMMVISSAIPQAWDW